MEQGCRWRPCPLPLCTAFLPLLGWDCLGSGVHTGQGHGIEGCHRGTAVQKCRGDGQLRTTKAGTVCSLQTVPAFEERSARHE